jgi:hypothetical protein
MLIDAFLEPCILYERKRESDGEGGFTTQWVESVEFEAAITFNDSMESRIAEKEGVTSRFTVTTNKNACLAYHDVFKRLSDGKIFRVTSDGSDRVTPDTASFQYSRASAEEWTLNE